jgi:phage gpG-like protein
MAEDVKNVVLNDWGAITTSVRTRATGKERVTIEIRGEALIIDTDEKNLMKPIALAMANEIKKGVRMFHGMASAGTRKARERAAKAFDDGKSWARKRYAGGRIGAMRPNSTGRLLNDSGRLEKSIAVGVTNAKEYVVNVAANRLGPDSAVRRKTLDLLRPIVDAAMGSKAAADAVTDVLDGMVVKAGDLRAQSRSQLIGTLKETLGSLGGLGNATDDFTDEQDPERR